MIEFIFMAPLFILRDMFVETSNAVDLLKGAMSISHLQSLLDWPLISDLSLPHILLLCDRENNMNEPDFLSLSPDHSSERKLKQLRTKKKVALQSSNGSHRRSRKGVGKYPLIANSSPEKESNLSKHQCADCSIQLILWERH